MIGSSLSVAEATRQDWDVIVVGAGLAGLAAAMTSARRGLRTLVLERAMFPRFKVCGGCLNGRALSVLREAGVLEALRATGARPLSQFHLASAGRQARLPLPEGLGISRAVMDTVFAQQCMEAGCAMLFGASASLGEAAPEYREVHVKQANASGTIRGRVVVSADGLHGSLLRGEHGGAEVARGARVGVGALSEDTTGRFESGVIHMAVAPHGYVGATVVEAGRIDMAAAFDPAFMKASGGPRGAVESVLHDAGLPIPQDIEAMDWKGTPPLTRRAPRLHADRVLVAGDSAGYIEPFTGEGMAWALSAGWSLGDRLEEGARAWRSEIGATWERDYRRVVRRRQWICRGLAWTLRQPPLVAGAMRFVRAWPGAARPILQYINTPAV